MSFCKCIKLKCIQVFNGPVSIKCGTESMLRVHISHASIENTLVMVVVIVVRYYSYLQNSLLTTNQDFHTQMWQEKTRCCTIIAKGFSRGPVSHRMRASNSFETYSSRTVGFESHVHHSNHVPQNGAFTTRLTSVNACCTHVRAHLTASCRLILN